MGDRVRVRVDRIDRQRRQIQFSVVGTVTTAV
jgi:exoribonuclease R